MNIYGVRATKEKRGSGSGFQQLRFLSYINIVIFCMIFTGLSDFKGSVLHSHDYRDCHGFEDQNVLVVGFGNSAGDTAVDVSNVAKQVSCY